MEFEFVCREQCADIGQLTDIVNDLCADGWNVQAISGGSADLVVMMYRTKPKDGVKVENQPVQEMVVAGLPFESYAAHDPVDLTPKEAIERWGTTTIPESGGVVSYPEIVAQDGTWRPMFNGWLQFVGYSRETSDEQE